MTNHQAMSAVLNYVMTKDVQLKVKATPVNVRRTTTFDMDQEDAQYLLAFIEQKIGCTREVAQNIFLMARQQTMTSAVYPTYRTMGFRLAVSLGVLAVPALLLYAFLGKAASVFVLPILCLLLFLWVWKPRRMAMDEVWNHNHNKEKRLERLYELQQMPLRQLIWQHQRSGLIVCLAVLAISAVQVAIGIPALMAKISDSMAQARANQAFQQEMSTLTVSPDNAGTKYVAHVVEENEFTVKYIPEAYQAETAADVRAVLRITADVQKVGEYSDGGGAYKRFVLIEVVDLRTGEAVLSDTVYGDDPPSRVQTTQGVQSSGYGGVPQQQFISQACARLIAAFEEMAK